MTENTVLGPEPVLTRALAAARRAPVTVFFLACCVALFAVAERYGSTEDVATLVRFGATERGHVWAGEWWRLLSAPFLHIGFMHLAWNMVGLFGWCTPVERTLGSRRFAVVYLGAAIAGSAASLATHDVVSAGASGAGFGIVGAWLALDARRLGSWRAFAADPHVRRTAGSALVWTVVLISMNVDHAAHLGGFVGGIALTWALTVPPDARPLSPHRARSVAVLAVLVPAVLAVIPRPGLTRYGAQELESELAAAMERGDLDAAEGVLARAANLGYSSPMVEYDRGSVHQQRGDLDGAARAYEKLASSSDPKVRRAGVAAGKVLLASRLMDGLGMPRDLDRARKLLEEVCADGDGGVCEWLEKNPTTERGAGAEKAGGP